MLAGLEDDRVAGANGAAAIHFVEDEPLGPAGGGGTGVDFASDPSLDGEIETVVTLKSDGVAAFELVAIPVLDRKVGPWVAGQPMLGGHCTVVWMNGEILVGVAAECPVVDRRAFLRGHDVPHRRVPAVRPDEPEAPHFRVIRPADKVCLDRLVAVELPGN